MPEPLKAPFPYFGGKSTIAEFVWQALGQPKHYLEPFFGSGAVLLNRPDYVAGEHVESVCDKDGHVCNVWRAMQADPDAVAKLCDWPVNHADLSARKRRMLEKQDELLAKLIADPDYYDVTLAGYWIWAASCWIGSGLTRVGSIPHISNAGKGVHALGKLPHVSTGGNGVHALGQAPHVSTGGKGVHALGQVPHVSDGGKGVQDPYNTRIYEWFRELSERLRQVRVVCGEWTRVCGGHWQDKIGDVGIFFDPPYAVDDRDTSVYHHDSTDVAHAVRAWCVERGDNPLYRIVLAGYDEHQELEQHGWSVVPWKAQGGYANKGNVNRHRERLYLSPHCQTVQKQTDLYA